MATLTTVVVNLVEVKFLFTKSHLRWMYLSVAKEGKTLK